MKRTIVMVGLCLVLLCFFALTGCVDKTCQHSHTTVITVEATCSQDGSKTVTCDDCGEEVSRETHKSNGHVYDVSLKMDATCTTDGLVYRNCRYCGDAQNEVLEALGHDCEIKTVEATCTTGKKQLSTCTRCESVVKRETISEPLGHDNHVISRVEPTLHEDGRIEYACARCSLGDVVVLPALGGDSVDNLPADLRFDGEEFVIAGWKGGNLGEYGVDWANYLDCDRPQAGNVMQEAAHERNEEIRQRFGVEISYDSLWNWNQTSEGLMAVIGLCSLSGRSPYDLVTYDQYGHESLIIDELVADVAAMPYIDLDKSYYNQEANNAYYLRNNLYVLYSDITYPTQTAAFMTVNNDILTDLGYGADFLVNKVENGEWTLELLFDMIDGLWVDFNKDGVGDAGDYFGLSGGKDSLCYLYPSSGLKGIYIEKNGFAFDYGTDYAYEVMDRILDLAADTDVYLSQTDYGNFARGRSLFGGNGPVLTDLSKITFSFDILPYPKYRETAESYTNLATGGIVMIPANIKDKNFVGAIVEAMASGSAQHTVSAFYENAVEKGILPTEFSVNNWKHMLGDWALYSLTDVITPDDRIRNYAPAFVYIIEQNRNFRGSWSQMSTVEEICQEFYDWYLS